MPDYHRILITGAAGSLGSHLRGGLAHLADRLRLVDIRDLGDAAPHEEIVRCDLADKAAALAATRDCDAIVHFAGHPREQSFEEIVADTLPAAYHVFEGARRHGCRRVVYASSIHAVGFHPVEAVPDTRVMHRPDTFYGLTKTFTEDLGQPLLGQVRAGERDAAHLLLLRGAERPAHALVLAQLRRLRAPGRGGAARAAGRLLGDLRHLRQRRAPRSRTPMPRTSASRRRTAPTASRRRSSPAPTRPDPAAVGTRVVGGGFAATGHPDDAG